LKTKRSPMHQLQGPLPTKPPPATRHRAVLSFRKSVPLYDMRLHTSSAFQDILQSSSNAEKLMMVTTVSTGRISCVEEDPSYLELWISFFSGECTNDVNHRSKVEVKVVMPQGWTPKMYLAALNKSTKKHSVVSIELLRIEGRSYATVNELQWLFSATNESTHSQLICSASYIRVSGGVFV
jgi:hypothetical protein